MQTKKDIIVTYANMIAILLESTIFFMIMMDISDDRSSLRYSWSCSATSGT